MIKVYGKDNWGFIEADNYKILVDTILELNIVEETEQNLVNNIKNQSQPFGFDLNEIPGEENFTNFQPDPPITNHPDQDDTLHVTGTTDRPENQEGTEYINDSDVAPAEEMPEQVLPVEDRELAYDIWRRKPCYGWISDDEDDELVILEGSTQ